ncbi:phospho-sugar mutase [Enemella sp. A6]|uniref:phospho-sugar mutase n=1 Tax=Enemella sp. A6 TaxID=3440152 RepID=UPI003EBB7F54
MSRLPHELAEQVEAWIDQDPDPITAAAAGELLTRARRGDDAAIDELASCFAGPLEFGTAGLRAALGPGPSRMNRVVVTRAAAGLGAHLQDIGAKGGLVLVGHDARYNSDVFARDTVEVLAGIGFDAVLIDEPVPTPVVAFGIKHLGAVAGVVVTASHNPAADNGYKVYLGDGIQIIPPSDAQIARRIAQVATVGLDRVPRADSYRTAGPELIEAYLDRAVQVARPPQHELRWVYTPLHGVGTRYITELATRAGFTAPHVVPAQAEPDPAFSTVAFPNPEEPGALDLAFAHAARVGAHLIIANDPDADRCAVAIPTVDGWRRLTGDEVGWLLADDLLRHDTSGTYATTVVSSTLLAKLAAAHGERHATTLTGFKWISRAEGLVFGYEEAIGYCTDPEAVADKDGLTAALRLLTLVCELAARGESLATRLDEIARTHGLHLTDQIALRVDQQDELERLMARARRKPPVGLIGEVVTVTDLAEGGELPATDAVQWAGRGLRVVLRPSGTEPKLKCYLELACPAGDDLAATRARQTARMAELRTAVQQLLDRYAG